jgi:hypothetical protein
MRLPHPKSAEMSFVRTLPVAAHFTYGLTRKDSSTRHKEYTMNMIKTHTNYRIEPLGRLALRDAGGSTVTCVTGCVWLTMEGDTRDVVLAPGASFVIDQAGLTIIAAEEPALVQVTAANRATWWARIANLIGETYGPAAIKPARKWVY